MLDTITESNLFLPLLFFMKKSKDFIKSWEKFFKSIGLPEVMISEYVSYIVPLIEKDLPIIFEINHLSKLLGRKQSYLTSVAFGSEKHYRTFEIPKKSGGVRIISSPYPALLECQYWIYNNILSKVQVHNSAQAYVSDRSIITNAKIHIGNKLFLKIDLKDFYSSIKRPRIVWAFRALGYAENVSFLLASLCCKEQCLPQGAPTSPVLSNIISYHLDVRLSNLSKKLGIVYSRYADDMAFSGDNFTPHIIRYIEKIINAEGFEINHKKTIFQIGEGKRILTGISIAEDVIKIPREYKRKLRQEVHYIFQHGVISHMNKTKIKNPYYLKSISGKLGFWISVEPNNTFAKAARLKINEMIEKYK